jgi:hypothetical protein
MERYLNLRVKMEESCKNSCAKCDRLQAVKTTMRKHGKKYQYVLPFAENGPEK